MRWDTSAPDRDTKRAMAMERSKRETATATLYDGVLFEPSWPFVAPSWNIL